MNKSNLKLESSMQLAVDGSKQAVHDFYLSFLDGPLFVPERFQEHPLSNSPEYPDEFLNILGIKSATLVYVPVFTKAEHILTWCGNEFKFRQITGKELLKLLPESWWIVVNPGQEIEKEISDWEISQLKLGPESIDEIVSEVLSDSSPESVEVEPLKGSDYPSLRRALTEACAGNKSIRSTYLLKEVSRNSNDFSTYTVLIGVEIDDLKNAIAIKDYIKSVADECQIGSDPARVITGISIEDTLMLGVFKGTEPLYQRAPLKSFIARFLNF